MENFWPFDFGGGDRRHRSDYLNPVVSRQALDRESAAKSIFHLVKLEHEERQRRRRGGGEGGGGGGGAAAAAATTAAAAASTAASIESESGVGKENTTDNNKKKSKSKTKPNPKDNSRKNNKKTTNSSSGSGGVVVFEDRVPPKVHLTAYTWKTFRTWIERHNHNREGCDSGGGEGGGKGGTWKAKRRAVSQQELEEYKSLDPNNNKVPSRYVLQ